MKKILITAFSIGLIFVSCNFQGGTYPADPKPGEQIQSNSNKAIVSGKVSYPSDAVPEDLTIFFVNQDNGKIISSREWNRTTLTYSVELEAPAYYEVYASSNAMPGYRAYYSQFVTCGLKAECTSHEAITLKVEPGANISNIDPGDWYAN